MSVKRQTHRTDQSVMRAPSRLGGTVGDDTAGAQLHLGGDPTRLGTETRPPPPKRLRVAVGPLSRFLVAGFVGRCGGRIRVGDRARIRLRTQGIAPSARRYRL